MIFRSPVFNPPFLNLSTKMGLPRRIFHTAKTVSHLGHFRRLLGSLPRECVCASKKLVPHSLSFDTKLRTLKKIKSSSFRCTFGLDENVCEKCNSFGVERALWVKNHKKIYFYCTRLYVLLENSNWSQFHILPPESTNE